MLEKLLGSGGGLMNNPLALTLIIVAVIAVAVGLILYFTIFRKKLKAKIADVQVRQKQKQEVATKNKDLATNVFKEKEAEENKKPTKEELEAFDQKFKMVVNEGKKSSVNERNFQKQVEKKKAGDEDKDKPTGYDIMGQFGGPKNS